MKLAIGLIICFIGVVLTNFSFNEIGQTGNIVIQTAGFLVIILGLYVIVKGRKQT
ncbi:hypothetical protein JMA_04630 [Jeotgalibacillus malaysiensis]|uniref:Uncharacterized protein n=1 Tax=Jeotgalibacillus malaysiensis TaxID=1508404 RepID=A0A0B5AHA4_9BACL|nr:hypothetical protein [Jeotgalibacillus malaysiensis]AJD89780.1 hypothetical protein JMA_04630 [Jeotgalibacillus malaysiensis]